MLYNPNEDFEVLTQMEGTETTVSNLSLADFNGDEGQDHPEGSFVSLHCEGLLDEFDDEGMGQNNGGPTDFGETIFWSPLEEASLYCTSPEDEELLEPCVEDGWDLMMEDTASSIFEVKPTSKAVMGSETFSAWQVRQRESPGATIRAFTRGKRVHLDQTLAVFRISHRLLLAVRAQFVRMLPP